MNVTFHVLAAVGIAHVAAVRLEAVDKQVWLPRARDLVVLGAAMLLGVLSHGVLDGLKHGYPIAAWPDVLCGAVLLAAWCLAVQRRYVLLFAAVGLAALAPDILDNGLRVLPGLTGAEMPTLFPWHWADGSGSMYAIHARAPTATRILDVGQNTIVSWSNHVLVLAFAAAGVLFNPHVWRLRPSTTSAATLSRPSSWKPVQYQDGDRQQGT
ncbi:MAG: hypothetical protein FWD68_12205 [Alphaproteobacteria bacterium]|nr:hypothetical protein [Alphaproteobacteria bacterium]